jgi:WD40 repeat protein
VVVDAKSNDWIAEWPATMKAIHDVVLRPDGKVVAVVGGDPAELGRIELRAWPSGEVIESADCGEDVVYSVAWDERGDQLVTGDASNQVHLWQADPLEIAKVLPGHSRPVFAVAFLPQGELVISAGQDQSLRVWDRATGTVRRRLDHSTGAINDLAVRPDTPGGPPWVATVGEDRAVRFLQPTIGRMIRFARLDAVPLSVCWMTGEGPPRVAVGCDDGSVRVVNAETLQETKLAPSIDGWCYEVVAARGGKLVAAGTGEEVWEPN